MKKQYLIILILFLIFNNEINSQQISEQAEISIITCAPGEDLYSIFGHSAIRVKDPVLRIDNVYNYGTFNFETPNFYIKFMRGQLDYMLSVVPYRYFVISYMNENRWIKEQVLDLSFLQKKKVYSFLENNALPENMYYRYDFFYDNCATRVKDVIKTALEGELILPDKITKEGETYRHLVEIYLKGRNWERYGINLALGKPTDKIVTAEEATFLPDYLELSFEKAIIKSEGKEKSIVKESRMLFEPKNKKNEKSESVIIPIVIFSVLLFIFLVFTFLEIRNNKYYLILDKTLFFIVGLTGFVVLLLWFGTEHGAVVNNWNILWAMPLFLIAAFRLKKNNNLTYLKLFMIAMSVILSISLIFDIMLFHLYDFATIPVVIILIIRTWLIYKKR